MTAWTGKVLDCETTSGKAFGLTLRSAGNAWETNDPKALIDPDQGTFLERMLVALPVTGCFDGNDEILMLNAHASAIAENDNGSGKIIDGDDFFWKCTFAN